MESFAGHQASTLGGFITYTRINMSVRLCPLRGILFADSARIYMQIPASSNCTTET